jgi:protein gp37
MVPWGSAWPPNVQVGTSVENQRYADARIPLLLELVSASVRFLSCEPLLGPLDLSPWLAGELDVTDPPAEAPDGGLAGGMQRHGRHGDRVARVDWVIVGGESGSSRRREMDLDAASSLITQCRSAGVPVFVKQDSGPGPGMQGRIPDRLWQVKEFPPAPVPAREPAAGSAGQ